MNMSCDMLSRSQTRIDLLFTMSEIPQARPKKDDACEVMFSRTILRSGWPVFAQEGYAGHHASSSSSVAAPRVAEGEAWWSQTGSNRRPHACKARALPAELWPRTRRRMLYAGCPSSPKRATPGTPRFVLRGSATRSRRRSVVGLGRLELPTSRLSSARSNQLSYKPLTLSLKKDPGHACAQPT